MEVATAKERVYMLNEQHTFAQIKERAWDQKTNVFGGVTKLLFRPRNEDVQLGYNEKRYEPFWHVVCRTSYIYDCKRKFVMPVSGPAVKSITVEGQDYPVEVIGDVAQVTFAGIEHCEENQEHEHFVDAITAEKRPWKHYLHYNHIEIPDITNFAPEGAMVVPPVTRASFVVRQFLSEVIRAIHADVVYKDTVEISTLDLYFRPIYAFEYLWPSRNRTVVAEFDGLTGEMRTTGTSMYKRIGEMLTPEVLFDIGSQAADVLLPGSGVALKVFKVAHEFSNNMNEPPRREVTDSKR